MPRTTINLDRELLRQARELLGTTGVTATVNAALAEVVRRRRLAAFDARVFDVAPAEIEEGRRDRLAG